MTTIMEGSGTEYWGLGKQKTPRASRLGLGVRCFWCLSRLCTTSGPATQAGKGKPEVIKRCATHDRIMARALEGCKNEKQNSGAWGNAPALATRALPQAPADVVH